MAAFFWMVYLTGCILAYGLAKSSKTQEWRRRGYKWSSLDTLILIYFSVFSFITVALAVADILGERHKFGLCFRTPKDLRA